MAEVSEQAVAVPGVDVAALAELAALTPVERFDQLVRTVRFIEAGRDAVARRDRG